MASLSAKYRIKAILYSRITLGVLLIICLFMAMSVYERFSIERDMQDRRVVAEEELKRLEERREGLEEKVDYLNDERGVEAEIRKHFDVATEGEQVVVLIDKERPETDSASTTIVPPEDTEGFWSRFWSTN